MSRLRSIGFWLTVVVLAALYGPAIADLDSNVDLEAPRVRFNTLYGPVGLLTVPTAYVAPHRKVLFGTAFARDVKTVTGNWGIVSGVDVGAAYLDRDSGTQRVLGNAKVNIIPQNFKWFEVGIGVLDATDALQQTFYFVASADWALPDILVNHAIGFRLHAGVGTGMFEEKPIGGAELVLDKRFSVAAEWNAKDFNAAARYVHDENFRLQLGMQGKKGFFSATYALQF
jgi:hypothetical protein